MQDSVSLHINGTRVDHFISYSIESNLFVADDAFRLELANPEVEITEGSRCEVSVNNRVELTGIADRISESYDKGGRKLTLEGRDLLGLLTDTCCEEFPDRQEIDLAELAKTLLKNVAYLKRKEVRYDEGVETQQPIPFAQIEPGQTVFAVLKHYAQARGLIFFSNPDGDLLFGRPRAAGKAEYVLTNRKDGKNNNVISGDRTRNISGRYSKVVVLGQRQGTDKHEAADVNVREEAADDSFPFYKPFVQQASHDGEDLKKHATTLLEQQRFASLQLSYRTFGHSQNGKNWKVNTICHVDDEVFGLHDNFLIYSRAFEMSRDGVFTTLKLSKLGIVPE